MIQIGVGNNTAAARNIITLAVDTGQTVNVANIAGSRVNYFTNGVNGPIQSLLAGNNVDLIGPAYIQSMGISTVQLRGGQYG